MFVEKVGVVGAGAMGAAIAEVLALNDKQVVLKDVKEEFVKSGMARVRTILDELVAFHAGKAPDEIRRIEALGITLSEDQKATIRKARAPTYDAKRAEKVFDRITPTTDYKALADADLVIEAVVEDISVKKKVFAELEAVTRSHVVLATNTSVLSVTEIAAGTKRRQPKVLGVHFFNPPYTLPLVEVVPGLETSPGTVDEVVQFLEELRNHRFPLQPIIVKERPGFVVNRILGRALAEAFLIYEEGAAQPRDIDKACRAGLGWPMGPLELADLVGVDVIHHVMEGLKRMGATGPQAEPQIVKQLFHSGRFGKKAGRGFYDYTAETE